MQIGRISNIQQRKKLHIAKKHIARSFLWKTDRENYKYKPKKTNILHTTYKDR
jgi:hypothetical protein